MIKEIHVYDVDGTLVDSSHRYRNLPCGRIDLEHWNANLHRTMQDKLLPLAKQYKQDIADPETYVIICTMRPPRPLDLQFIRERLGQPDKLITNRWFAKKDMQNFKRAELTKVFNLRQFRNVPRYFWEDTESFIDSCRDLFTRCYLVQSNQNFTTE